MRAYGGRNVGAEAAHVPSSTAVVDKTCSALIDGVLGDVDYSEICRFRSYFRVDGPLLDLSRTRKVLVIPNRGSQVTQLFHYQTLVAST